MSEVAQSGFNMNTAFEKISAAITARGNQLEKTMSGFGTGENISDQDMLKMQFQVNQYNVFLETASTITKALTDQAKQLAQRSS